MGSRRSTRCGRTVSRILRPAGSPLVFLWLIAVLPAASHGGGAPDDGLLEFLGSVDTEDKDWHDYLARTDIDKIARRAGNDSSHPSGGSVPARVKPVDPPADQSADPSAAKPVGAAPP